MGKRKDPKRRKILQLKTNQETYTQIWPRNHPAPQTQAQNMNMDNGNVARNNALSGLLSHYMDCDDDDDDEDSEGEQGENIETENANSNPHAIDLEVADFLKEIDAITSDDQPAAKEEEKVKVQEDKQIDKNQWQECVDETTGYTYYWNVNTNEVSWEYPKTFTLNTTLPTTPVITKKHTTAQKSNESEPKPVDESPDSADDGKIVPITFYGPGSSNGGSSNGESSNEDADSPSVEKHKMGPHLPPVDEFDLDINRDFESPDDLSNSSVPEQLEEPDSTARAKQAQQIKEVTCSNLFCGPPNAAQVLASSLDDESDSEEMPASLFLPTVGQAKHKGLGFGLKKVENVSKGGKGDKISFVKAETLDLNAINRIAVCEWPNEREEPVELKIVEQPKLEIKVQEEGEVEIDVDRELDLALERNVKDDVTQLANGILSQLDRLGVNSSSVSNLQRFYIETQTRLEDFRQGALKRSYLLTKLREMDNQVEELHQLHTCKDRIECEVDQPDTTGNTQQTTSVVSSSTAALFAITGSVEGPPLPPPPPPPESPPPPPPDSTAHESGGMTTMEIDDSIEGTQLSEPEMQMELNTFYSDILMLSEPETPLPSVPVPVPSTSGLPSVTAVPSVSSSENSSVVVVKKEKKIKKARMSTGLVLKKKNMPYLVEKWQKIKRDEAKNASSSDEEKGGVSTTRQHTND